MSHKINLRWYLTPSRIARFHPQASPLCWRRCGQAGTLLHMLWGCPKLGSYWTDVYSLISRTLRIPTPLTPALAICSLGIEAIPHHLRTVLLHILLAARLTILRHWKDHTPPTIAETLNTIHTHASYELMFSYVIDKHHQIAKLWAPWTSRYPVMS